MYTYVYICVYTCICVYIYIFVDITGVPDPVALGGALRRGRESDLPIWQLPQGWASPRSKRCCEP